jgi:hypothetical protein
MYFSISLRGGIVYVPTMGKMDKGFYRGIEPVTVVPATNSDALRTSLLDTIARGNPVVPVPKRREWPPPVVLRYAGVKSWPAFERGMALWGIEERDGIWHIIGKRKKADGTTIDDPEQTISFPPGAPVQDVVNRMIAILQQAAQK